MKYINNKRNKNKNKNNNNNYTNNNNNKKNNKKIQLVMGHRSQTKFKPYFQVWDNFLQLKAV